VAVDECNPCSSCSLMNRWYALATMWNRNEDDEEEGEEEEDDEEEDGTSGS
jgi:hypothetical protein